mmetsp:Transcript_12604/g.38792  ORF Transcript_12604/g.38792 Transcript_12604/m.38792 type:complete len:463 (+) Transcript_12604:279-1667(+)
MERSAALALSKRPRSALASSSVALASSSAAAAAGKRYASRRASETRMTSAYMYVCGSMIMATRSAWKTESAANVDSLSKRPLPDWKTAKKATAAASAGDARPSDTESTCEHRKRKIARHSFSRTSPTRSSKPGSQPNNLKLRMPRSASPINSSRRSANPRLTFCARFVTRARRVLVKSTQHIVATPATVGTNPRRVKSMTQPPTMATIAAGAKTRNRDISTMDTRSLPTKFASDVVAGAPAGGALQAAVRFIGGATAAASASRSAAARLATSVDAISKLRSDIKCELSDMSICARPSQKTVAPNTTPTSTLRPTETSSGSSPVRIAHASTKGRPTVERRPFTMPNRSAATTRPRPTASRSGRSFGVSPLARVRAIHASHAASAGSWSKMGCGGGRSSRSTGVRRPRHASFGIQAPRYRRAKPRGPDQKTLSLGSCSWTAMGSMRDGEVVLITQERCVARAGS